MKTLCLATTVLFTASAGAAFKCVDEKGLTHVGDTPPDPCANVVMYEVTRSGAVIRKIEPSLTPEQVKARVEAEGRRKESEKVANEQKRKDLALLATFSSEAEFDLVRDRTIEPINGRIKSAQERVAAIDKRVKELDDEMEFYKAGKSSKSTAKKAVEAPSNLTAEIDRLKAEKQNLAKGVTSSEREIVELRKKFDVDKKRWLALKTAGGAATVDPKAGEPKTVEVKGTTKK
jgi:chromosome segregation ATPase